MARNYGRIATSMWRDSDFLGLGSDARFVYAMLVTQANISACGVLELTERRWARNVGLHRDRLDDALGELTARAYIVIDRETEEVLIRTFVKWDGGANNELRRKAIADAAEAVASESLRAVIAVELDRIGVENGLSKPYRGPIDSRRVVVTEGDKNPNPQPTTHEGEPSASNADAPPSQFCSKHPTGTEDNCGPCGTARRRYDAWLAAKPERDRRAKAAAAKRQAEIAGCPDCQGSHWRDDGSRCDHPRIRRTA